MPHRFDVAIVGSGFAGSILARVLATRGLAVTLLERSRHPRFALGESSTPLAALCLERLARTYGLADLEALAAWGRWRERLPALGCGRKRGFTFYRHRPGLPFDPGPHNERRLLVAASPTDAIADCHWVRSPVDAFLVEQARARGAHYLDELRLETARLEADAIELAGTRHGAPVAVHAAFAVDATGPAGFLPRALGLTDGRKLHTCAGLLYGHFTDVAPLVEAAGPFPGETPYPEQWAAVHHLVDEGWLYELRFDSGLVSAGLLADGGLRRDVHPEAAWAQVLARYPSLARQFARAQPTRPVQAVPLVQYRRGAAAGPRWAALPHAYAFIDPLFSTGIAWSLLGVERLADLLLERGPDAPGLADGRGLIPYMELLTSEAEQIDRLVAGAYRARGHFELFVAQSLLYFALVSFAEARQRLLTPPRAAWEGFLAAGEPEWEAALDEALARLQELTRPGHHPSSPEVASFTEWIRTTIAPRDVAGLSGAARGHLFPVDLAALRAAADRLGLTPQDVDAALPRLRGAAP